jgi:Flp pilus assembly pilin Flp
MLPKNKAQGLLEYTIMIAAVVAIIMVVMLQKNGVGTSVKTSYLKMGDALTNTTNDLTSTISSSQ